MVSIEFEPVDEDDAEIVVIRNPVMYYLITLRLLLIFLPLVCIIAVTRAGFIYTRHYLSWRGRILNAYKGFNKKTI